MSVLYFKECKTGFKSRNGKACEPCIFNFFGKRCTQKCNCNNLQRCDTVKGCIDVETTGIPKVISSDENMTTEHKDNENDGTGISKTELLMLYSGASSGIILILGMLGILYCINRRICKPKSKHVKTSKADVLQLAEHETQDTLELYEEIDESKFESILHSPTCSPNMNKVDGSLSFDSTSNCNLNTSNKSLCQENGNSQKAVSLWKKSNEIVVVQSSPVIQ
ncbi:unnamed protein product [Mytilus coruscus]|uniref:MEGF10_11 n=1 Tax=Mytilus coruscus TaxID=42192 RepID=A0A6J8F145_MYTCO|nr:unnamed protein product [Mytilus coruscus]